jgi:hypothetical protein
MSHRPSSLFAVSLCLVQHTTESLDGDSTNVYAALPLGGVHFHRLLPVRFDPCSRRQDGICGSHNPSLRSHSPLCHSPSLCDEFLDPDNHHASLGL